MDTQLDPQAQALLNQIAASGAPAPRNITEARQGYLEIRQLAGAPEPVNKVEDRQILGAAGIPVRIYSPLDELNLPVLVYFHGGSFTVGDLDTHDAPLRALANRAGCIVVAVAYRLAPENQFPAAPEDAYAVTKWVVEHTAEIGGDATRVAVGGDSAGGNLAAVVTLIARDRNSPTLVYQVLIYPNTDATMSSASWQELGNKGYILTTEGMASSLAQYLPDSVDKKNPYLSPLWANLNSLPPALVIIGECDPLRDEDEAYAERLKQAGVPVVSKHYEGMIHGFFQMAGALEAGKKVIEEIAANLKQAFAQ